MGTSNRLAKSKFAGAVLAIWFLMAACSTTLIQQPYFGRAKSNVVVAINASRAIDKKGGHGYGRAAAGIISLSRSNSENAFNSRYFIERLPAMVEKSFSKVNHWKLIPHEEVEKTAAYRGLLNSFQDRAVMEINADGYLQIKYDRGQVHPRYRQALLNYMREANVDQVTLLYFALQYVARGGHGNFGGRGGAQPITRMYIDTYTREGEHSVLGAIDVPASGMAEMVGFMIPANPENFEVFENHLQEILDATVERINREAEEE